MISQIWIEKDKLVINLESQKICEKDNLKLRKRLDIN